MSASKASCAAANYESQGAKIRTYDIVASSIINLRAGQRDTRTTQTLPFMLCYLRLLFCRTSVAGVSPAGCHSLTAL